MTLLLVKILNRVLKKRQIFRDRARVQTDIIGELKSYTFVLAQREVYINRLVFFYWIRNIILSLDHYSLSAGSGLTEKLNCSFSMAFNSCILLCCPFSIYRHRSFRIVENYFFLSLPGFRLRVNSCTSNVQNEPKPKECRNIIITNRTKEIIILSFFFLFLFFLLHIAVRAARYVRRINFNWPIAGKPRRIRNDDDNNCNKTHWI